MKFNKFFTLLTSVALAVGMAACDDDDPVIVEEQYGFGGDFSATEMNFSYENDKQNVSFTALGKWHIDLEEGCDWVYFTPSVGQKGKNTVEVSVAQNVSSQPRAAAFYVTSGEERQLVTVRQPEFGGTLKEIEQPDKTELDPSEVPDWDKFWANSEHGAGILKLSSKFSFARYKSSEHFFVFWDTYFGDDPNGPLVPASQRVDVDDLLAKAEHFFETNINKLGMAVLGQGKSQLDKYKMQIYLLDPTPEDWVATGSGYDNVIGALWVTPATCHPVGSTIAHEIGHSFQYQVYCDKILQGAPDNGRHGFRYGFDAQGIGGCAYWEQCAQWQAQVDYPEEMFGYHVPTWTANCHRVFYHEWMRYASYWLQHDWVNRHGIEAYGRIWRESAFPEDPIETYTRLYNGGDMQKTYDELYDYAAHMVYYDIPGIREYANPAVKGDYTTGLYRTAENTYQVAYGSTPGTTGFNVIRLMTSAGKKVSVKVNALEAGSALAAKDPGSQLNGDGGVVGATKNYNSQSNKTANFRYGFVAVTDGKPVYSAMNKGAEGTASYNVPADADELYFVIMGAPDTYNRVPWDDNEANDEQWPYTIEIDGSDVYGYTEPELPVYEKVDDKTMNVTYGLSVNVLDGGWIAGNLNLMTNEVSEFFGIPFNQLNDAVNVPHAGTPVMAEDGKISIYNRDANGTLNNNPTANDGYWCDTKGNAIAYSDASIYFELAGVNLTLGKKGAVGVAGESWQLRPVYVYTNGNVTKTMNVTVTYKFAEPAQAPRKRVAYSRMKKF